MILLEVPNSTLLRVQRVNRQFRKVIKQSHPLRRKLFFLSDDDSVQLSLNPLICQKSVLADYHCKLARIEVGRRCAPGTANDGDRDSVQAGGWRAMLLMFCGVATLSAVECRRMLATLPLMTHHNDNLTRNNVLNINTHHAALAHTMPSRNLPTELLERIIDFLNRPELICFSKVNKQCYALCIPHKYREISLPSHGYEQYLEHIMTAVRYIRAIEIVWHKTYSPASLLSIQFPTLNEMPVRNSAPNILFEALSAFIEQTPNLTDFYWSFNQLLPATILAQLEQIGCRLHLRAFHPKFDGNEHRYLMLSPCLYSIKTSGYVSVQTLLPAIARTPHLKELYIGPYQLHIPELHFLRPIPPSRAQLTRLQLQCCGVMDLAKWIDYSTLQSLQLNRLTAAECISMARCDFPSLRQLIISRCHDDFLETFVPKLRLHELELGTVSERVLGIIFDSNGPKLERLRCVNTFVDEQWLHRYISQCQKLRGVAIGIKRCQGIDGGIYKCIGELPLLQGVHLVISSRAYSLTTLNKAHRGPLPDEMNLAYNTLRDLATDEQLVRSIYEAISAPCSLKLKTLTIKTHWPPLYFGNFTPSDLSLLTWAVTQHWQCKSGAHGCTVTPLDRQDPFLLSAEPAMLQSTAEGRLAAVTRQLWPESAYRPFAEAWHSFPILENPRPTYEIPCSN